MTQVGLNSSNMVKRDFNGDWDHMGNPVATHWNIAKFHLTSSRSWSQVIRMLKLTTTNKQLECVISEEYLTS